MKQPGKKPTANRPSAGHALSRKAEEEIIDIYLQGAERFGVNQAERYHTFLEKSFQFLADNPLAAHLRTEISPPVRVHPVESHITIYTINDDGAVYIIRIRHAHEDWLSQ